MRLLFDIGNSRIKWSVATGLALQESGSVSRGDEDIAQLADALRACNPDVSSAWAVNVGGPGIEEKLSDLLRKEFQVELQLARTQAQFGDVVNGYRSIEQLGADRWVAIVGAWQLYKENVCIVDAGTAVTIDLVESDGRHRGGIILPGLRLMAAALNRETSDIEGFASNSSGDFADDDWVGKDTLSAVQRGAQFALRASVLAAATADPGSLPRLVLTGGDAEQLLPLDGCDAEYRPELVLEGLNHIAEACGGLNVDA